MRRAFFLMVSACGLFGCAESGRPVVPVEGIVTRQGKPVPSLFLNFMPASGRPSWGQTDENGAFRLQYEPGRDGAEVGTHKVFVRFRAANPQDEFDLLAGKKKFHPDQGAIEAKYGKVESTPLLIEVKRGVSPLNIVVD